MKYTKKLAIMFGAIAAAAMLFVTGCHDETSKLEKCLKYAESAGVTVGYVVNSSVLVVGPEVKDTVLAVTDAIVTELPTNVTVETIAADLRTISTNAVHIALPDVCEKYPELVDSTINTLLGFLQIGLTSIQDKYPTEIGNAEMFYKIAYKFFDSVHSVIAIASNRNEEPAVEPNTNVLNIVEIDYESIKALAKIDGKPILSKNDFEALMNALKK